MIIPRFWGEESATHPNVGKSVKVRRFGWSETSQEDAQAHASTRLKEALNRIRAGEKLQARDRRVAYNGSEGVPIREEIVESDGATVVTRNAYGARCLNSPNVLFADIDFPTQTSCQLILIVTLQLVALALVIAWQKGSLLLAIVLLVFAIGLGQWIAWAIRKSLIPSRGGEQEIAMDRIRRFVEGNLEWSLRVYRTPLGLRIMGTHRLFDPNEKEVGEFFDAIGADPVYVRMCRSQLCFRARVSGKPWRMGIDEHLRGGVWPVTNERLLIRNRWIERYEEVSKNYASCEFIETLGNGKMDSDVKSVLQWHDLLCGVGNGLPLA